MTGPSADPPSGVAAGPKLPGEVESIALLSMIMALGALGIDMMLPAFDQIRADFDLGVDPATAATATAGANPASNEVARIVTTYFLGMALGPIPYGALSDRFGRRPVLWLSGTIYVIGATISALAPTFGLLLAGRFVWGVGASGGRVVAFAILRDTQEGDRMARMMSYMMAVFILVPIVAPSLGALILRFGSWSAVFGAGAALGVGVLAWSLRLPETLRHPAGPPPERPGLRPASFLAPVASTARRMASTVTVAAPVIGLTAVMVVMSSYLASSEYIIGELFDRGPQFPLVFGAVAAVLGLASLINGRLLKSLPIDRVVGPAAAGYLVGGLIVLGVTLAAGGRPGFWAFMPLLTATLAFQMLLMPAFNTMALAPMSEAAGTASALVATFSTAVGASLGALVDSRLGETVTPLAVALVAAGAVVAAASVPLRATARGR